MRRLFVLVVLVVLGLSACTSAPPSSPDGRNATTARVLPDGWRWESYRGVEVGVPGSWGAANGSQRIGQWCVEGGDRGPAVGRPGASTAAGCGMVEEGGSDPSPDPETLVANTGPIVAFEDAVGSDGEALPVARGGDREVVRSGDVYVVVQVPQPLRDRIAATVRRADDDANECPSTDPVTADPARRPDAPADVADLRGIAAVSICRYAIESMPARRPRSEPGLLSSTRLTGRDALHLVRQVGRAPRGGGPDSPGNCLASDSYGDEIVVLRIASAARASQVYVRYSGCDHHGFDDGIAVRRLVTEPVATILAGPNATDDWDGDLYAELFGSGQRQKR